MQIEVGRGGGDTYIDVSANFMNDDLGRYKLANFPVTDQKAHSYLPGLDHSTNTITYLLTMTAYKILRNKILGR